MFNPDAFLGCFIMVVLGANKEMSHGSEQYKMRILIQQSHEQDLVWTVIDCVDGEICKTFPILFNFVVKDTV